jgi:hypothetical protein
MPNSQSLPVSPNLPIDEPTEAISIQLTNLRPKDARFLNEIIKLFCDPAHGETADMVRRGRVSLQCDRNGELHITNTSMAYLHS